MMFFTKWGPPESGDMLAVSDNWIHHSLEMWEASTEDVEQVCATWRFMMAWGALGYEYALRETGAGLFGYQIITRFRIPVGKIEIVGVEAWREEGPQFQLPPQPGTAPVAVYAPSWESMWGWALFDVHLPKLVNSKVDQSNRYVSLANCRIQKEVWQLVEIQERVRQEWRKLQKLREEREG